MPRTAVQIVALLCLAVGACADDGEPDRPQQSSPINPVLVGDGGQHVDAGPGLPDAAFVPGSDGSVLPIEAGPIGGGALEAGAYDAAAPDAAGAVGPDAGSTNTPSTCTSNKHWTSGDNGSELMHPGRGCIACHTAGAGFLNLQHGPMFTIAGTVFPSAHEPDDCNGAAGSGITIVIKGANNQLQMLTPNAVGNFTSLANVMMPFTAEVHYQGRVRAMATPQSTGDCNTCHTETGMTGAPGRIMLP